MMAESRFILVVDDDPGTATLQRRRLERAGFRAQTASDVDGAMEILARHTVDLVVMDYRLGTTTTGLDLNRRIKAAGFDVPVILVSGLLDDAAVIEAMRAGVKDIVVKNLDYLDYLSQAVRAVLDQAAAVPERSGEDRRAPCILIVEDDPGVAALQQRQLQGAGYDVAIALSPQEALERVRRGNVNLALIDLRLADGASGLELYEQLKTEGWKTPAILVTGFPDQAVAIRALRAGVRDFVPKTTNYLEYLPAAVDRVIAQARVEHKLVESELRLASIVGTAMDAIAMCDDLLRVVLFNRSAEQMFGYPAGDVLGRSLPDLIPRLTVTELGEEAGSVGRRLEVEAVRAGGDRIPIEVSISDVVVHGRRLFTVIARDISERRRAESELREADRRKDVFLGMLAHELRNPLAAITTAGEVLHRTVDEPAIQRLINVIRRQTAALGRMVDDLLDISRVTQGKIQLAHERLLLSDLVNRAVETVRDAAENAGLRLDVHIGPDPVWLMGDQTRLEQVLANLLNNAVKFTPAGGTITLDARGEGERAVIRVRDTGVGIESALLPKVFELFVQGDTSLDRANSGLGIGLALVQQVVTLHGGRVTAHSAGRDKGSEFVVHLPATSAAPAADSALGESRHRQERTMRVLVVDDQPDLADCVAMMIETIGHEARAVYNGADALTVSRAEIPDLMLLDLGMPEMTGYELARAIRQDETLSNVPLIALSGYGRDEDRARAKEAGFDLHLTKPIADTKLRDVIESFAGARARQDSTRRGGSS